MRQHNAIEDVVKSSILCSACGHLWEMALIRVKQRVAGKWVVPDEMMRDACCPRCGGAALAEAACEWCDTMWIQGPHDGEDCPRCGHAPYWER